MLNARIKGYLNDIIDVAFADDPGEERKRYKAFKLRISTKENKTSSGTYSVKRREVCVFNPSLGAKHLAKCCLHELSHHIDYCQNGKSGHQKAFYDVYAKLVYASLDMGILEKKDFDDNWSSDQNKVRTILKKYVPHPVEYERNEKEIIRVYKGYDVRNELKEHGYGWNSLEQVWEKTVWNKQKEELFLVGLGVESYEIIKPDMYIDAIVYIAAEGRTYEKRDLLKEYRFYYDGEKEKWLKKVKSSEYNNIIITLRNDCKLSGIKFDVLKKR